MTTLRKITLQEVTEAKEHLNAYQVTIKDVNKEGYEALQPAVDQLSALISMIPADDASSEAKEPTNKVLLDAVAKTRQAIQDAVLHHGLKVLPDNFANPSEEAEKTQPFFTVFINKLIEQEDVLIKSLPTVEELEAKIDHLMVEKNEAVAKAQALEIQLIELNTKMNELRATIEDEENNVVVDLSTDLSPTVVVTKDTPRRVMFAKYQILENQYNIVTGKLELLKAEKIVVANTVAPADAENNPHYRDAMKTEQRRATAFENEKNRLAADNATLIHEIEALKKQLADLQREQEEKVNKELEIKMAEYNLAIENAKKANLAKDEEIAALKANPALDVNMGQFVAELGTPKKKSIAADGEGLMGAENSILISSSSATASTASSSMLPSRGWIGWMLVTFADLVLTGVSILSYVGLSALMASNPFTLGVGIGAGFTALFLGKKTYDEYQANKPAAVTQVTIEAVDDNAKASVAPTESEKAQEVDPNNVFVPVNASKENNVSEDNSNANDASGEKAKEISVASKTEISNNASSDASNDADAENSISTKKDETDPTAAEQQVEGENVHSIAAHLKAKSDADKTDETAKETLEGTNEGQKEGAAPRKNSKEGIDVIVTRKLSKELVLGDVTGMAALMGKRKDSPLNQGKVKADDVAAANLLKAKSADTDVTKKDKCTIM